MVGGPEESYRKGRSGHTEDKQIRPSEIIFEVTEAVEGRFDSRALGHSIFTQGEDWNDQNAMARGAVLCHFDVENMPRVITLHLVRVEAIAVCCYLAKKKFECVKSEIRQ